MTFPLAIPLAMTLPGNPVSWFNGSTRISLTNEQLGMFTKKDHPWNTLWGQHFYLLVVEFTVFCCFVFFLIVFPGIIKNLLWKYYLGAFSKPVKYQFPFLPCLSQGGICRARCQPAAGDGARAAWWLGSEWDPVPFRHPVKHNKHLPASRKSLPSFFFFLST